MRAEKTCRDRVDIGTLTRRFEVDPDRVIGAHCEHSAAGTVRQIEVWRSGQIQEWFAHWRVGNHQGPRMHTRRVRKDSARRIMGNDKSRTLGRIDQALCAHEFISRKHRGSWVAQPTIQIDAPDLNPDRGRLRLCQHRL